MNQIPPELKGVLSASLARHNVPAPPEGVPWQQQLEVLEARKRRELECFLQTALLKLSPSDDAQAEAFTEAATREMEALRQLLTRPP